MLQVTQRDASLRRRMRRRRWGPCLGLAAGSSCGRDIAGPPTLSPEHPAATWACSGFPRVARSWLSVSFQASQFTSSGQVATARPSLSCECTRDRSGSGRQVGLIRRWGNFWPALPCRESGLSLQGSGPGQGKEGWGLISSESDRPL